MKVSEDLAARVLTGRFQPRGAASGESQSELKPGDRRAGPGSAGNAARDRKGRECIRRRCTTYLAREIKTFFLLKKLNLITCLTMVTEVHTGRSEDLNLKTSI